MTPPGRGEGGPIPAGITAAPGGDAAAAWEPPGSPPGPGAPTEPAAASTARDPRGDPPPYTPPDPKSLYLLFPPAASRPGAQGGLPLPYTIVRSRPLPFAVCNGQPGGPAPPAAPPRDYVVESALVTVFCCLFTGVAALVYSHETRAALRRGDMPQARRASKKTQALVLFSLFFGLFVSFGWVTYVIIVLYV
ncbi:proline rich transmembrane protein 1B [Nothoprocta perdicaria]|uniref:proline rich transmembrane protein 1B n=1 Tax=Nothoprocta perdicaria TaxID=30464 RepID=UPI000E1BE219|nr:proline rich transmembrane protein 1B [Nothoprocta perdicaria]